jgi:hypothetical protein
MDSTVDLSPDENSAVENSADESAATEPDDSTDTEPYDLDNNDIVEIDGSQRGAEAPEAASEEDDDCVLIPQQVETIDLCNTTLPSFRIPISTAATRKPSRASTQKNTIESG